MPGSCVSPVFDQIFGILTPLCYGLVSSHFQADRLPTEYPIAGTGPEIHPGQ